MKKKLDNSLTSLNKTGITGQDANQTFGDISKFLDISEDDEDEYEPDKGARYHH
jgi:hypothetical protein